MTSWPADDVTLAYAGNSVRLRPSLRAAVQLEPLHPQFPLGLARKVYELDTRTIAAVLEATAVQPQDAHAFLRGIEDEPLRVLGTYRDDLFELCLSLIPVPEDDAPAPTTTTKPQTWATTFRQLYGFATGWLGWTPAEAWAATPQEIADAFAAHCAKLKATHGTAEDDKDPLGRTPEQLAEQRRQNLEAGLDPDFDRAAFNALKARL
jgi:hypothetical protein